MTSRSDNARIVPVFLSGDASHEIRLVPASDDGTKVSLEATLMGGKFPEIDLKFEYRLWKGEPWSPCSIRSSSGLADDGIARGLPCQPEGTTTIVAWEYAKNGLARGTSCEVRANVVPSPTIRSECLSVGWEETLSGDTRRIAPASWGIVAGRDSRGYVLLLEDRAFVVRKPTGDVVFRVGGFRDPKAAQETGESYVVLDSGNHSIVEVSRIGTTTKTYNGGGIILRRPEGMHWDPITRNLLVTGGEVNKAYEMTWSGSDWGTILWQHGTEAPGSGSSGFYQPMGICYGPQGRHVVVVADKGNSRVVVLTRNPSSTDVTSISSVFLASQNLSLDLASPVAVAAAGGRILVAESRGRIQAFAADRNEHPTLVRAREIVSPEDDVPVLPTLAASENVLGQYANLVFAPMLRAME